MNNSIYEQFEIDLFEYISNGHQLSDESKVFRLGKPSPMLLSAGVPNLEIIVPQAVIKKAIGLMKGKQDSSHCLKSNDLINLPHNIQAPVLVFDSITVKNSLVIITAIVDRNGQKAMVALGIKKSPNYSDTVNMVTSIYTRSDDDYIRLINKAISKNIIRYGDPTQAKSWFSS